MQKTVGLVAAAALLVGGASAAGAAEYSQRIEAPSLVLTPAEGPPGTAFVVAGADCDSGVVTVDTTASEGTSTTPSADIEVLPEQDGTWSVELTVDAGSVPYQSVVVDATCSYQGVDQTAQGVRAGAAQVPGFEYQRAYFEVLPDQTLSLDPSSGLAGSEFTVGGGTCDEFYGGTAEVSDGTTAETVEPDGDGDWTATFTVPDDAEPGDMITVTATCVTTGAPGFRSIRRGNDANSFDYTPVVFTVTAEPTSPSTPAPTSGGAVQAGAATPTTASPTFTG